MLPLSIPLPGLARDLRIIRRLLIFFMVTLFLSGLTAIPIDIEVAWVLNTWPSHNQLHEFIQYVYDSYLKVKSEAPFLLYGYDWLAFAHFVLAILFIGPYRDPVKNLWVIEFGLIACALIIPFALVAGSFRGIPLGWRFIDCSFGIIGSIPLSIIYIKIKKINSYGTY